MSISMLCLSVVACSVFAILFFAFIKSDREQFVSRFWAGLHKETETGTYFVVMWVLATAASLPLAVDSTVVPTMALFARDIIERSNLVFGAAVFAGYLTATLGAAAFSVGVALAFAWPRVRRVLRLRPKSQVVG